MNRIIQLAIIFCCSLIFANGAIAQTTGEITKGNCKVCANECKKALEYCAKKGGHYNEGGVTNVIRDCITACDMTGEFLARGSSFGPKSAAICIEACNNCAKAFEGFKTDDKMRAWADECRKCAGNCQKVKGGAT